MARTGSTLLLTAWSVAVVSTLGALFIGEVMGQMPCVLCWYQRIAMFPLAVLLGVAAYRDDASAWRYALPLAVIGLVLAGYHSLLFVGAIPAAIQPCTAAGPSCSGDAMLLFGSLPLPILSLAAFLILTVNLLLLRRSASQ
jgi:disulfide bond formation protein DsbB